MKAFKAYDIRGIYNSDFNAEDVYKIGFFLPSLLKADKILIGRDARTSSEEIFQNLCRGINDAGANVSSAGLTTTPMVYFGTAKYGFDASVMITASHNPPEYNGLKISRTGAVPVGYEHGLADLERMTNELPIEPEEDKGTVEDFDFKDDYIQFMTDHLQDISNLNFGVDCSNGMASILIKDILKDQPIYIFDELDCTFPNHSPNPLREDSVQDIKKLVTENNLDIGVIFDGDADRVMFIDNEGSFIPPDLIVGLIADHFLTGEDEAVLYDIRTSKSVTEHVQELGGTPHMWKVGHAYAKIKLREINAICGGELAGHYYFRDFFNCDSGILACLIVLDVAAQLKREGKSIAGYIKEIVSYANSGEVNFRIEQKKEAMQALVDSVSGETRTAFYDFDGLRIEFDDWWFNVRPSNTEPYLRLVVEARTEDLLKGKLSMLKDILQKFG